jgi:uncharacterized protein YjdB
MRCSKSCVWWLAALVVAAISCKSDSLDPDGGAVASVVIAPSKATVAVGATVPLSAEVLDAAGRAMTGHKIVWATGDAAIATVSNTGVVTGVAIGTVQVAASAVGKSAVAEVTVNPTPVASVRLSPTTRDLLVGQTVQLSAEPLDAQGNVLAGRPVVFTTNNATVATVSAAGLVTALAPGGTIITATSEGKSSVATITVATVPVASVVVTPGSNSLVVGQTTQLSAEPRDGSGNALPGRSVAWSTSAPSIASVSSTGLVTTIAPGTATITATSEGKSGTASVTVSPKPVSAVIVSPGQTSVTVGQTTQLNAQVTDEQGNPLSGRPISFTTASAAIATVSTNGLVTGVAVGSTTITATSEGKTGTATVTVTPIPVVSVVVTPGAPNVVVGQTVQLDAAAHAAGGQTLNGRPVFWSTGAPSVASVGADGVVTGLAPGTAVIFASIEGVVGTASVTVRQVPVASVVVTPSTSNVIAGGFVQLSASVRDASGVELLGRLVGWSSSDEAVAVVSSTGRVSTLKNGSVTITASSEGKSGTATVTIAPAAPAPVASVTITPPAASVAVGQTQLLQAQTLDASGGTLTGRAVAWSTSNAAVATVSPGGLVTGVAPGDATVSATSEGKEGTAAITVTAAAPVPVATVTVAPTTLPLQTGQTGTLTATTRDAANNVLTGRTVAWTTSNAGVATVAPNGTVTAVAVGTATITATSEGKTGTATVTVTAPALVPVATVTVAPSTLPLQVGQTGTLTATTRDAANNVLTGRTITWSSGSPGVATVAPNGTVTAVAPGSATITATSEGKTGTAAVTVTAVPVATVTVAPTSADLTIGGTQQITATPRDAQDNPLTGRVITWQTGNSAVATVTQTGLITAVGAGNTTVTATSEGQVGTVAVAVAPPAVGTVTVAPTSATVNVAFTTTLAATVRDVNGVVIPGAAVAWSSSNTLVAVVTQTGVVTGLLPGTATITASSGGKSGTSTITVQLAPVQTVTVTPSPLNLRDRDGQRTGTLTATVRDALGNILTGRTVTWSSSNTNIATVTQAGVVTAQKDGNVTVTATSEGKSGTASVVIQK